MAITWSKSGNFVVLKAILLTKPTILNKMTILKVVKRILISAILFRISDLVVKLKFILEKFACLHHGTGI